MTNRDEAWQLLSEYTKNPSLIKHALAVEAAMRHFAKQNGEDPERWGIVGLLHDFDYEQHPTLEEHAIVGASILRDRGWDEETIRAIQSHANHTGVTRESSMEKTLFAVDELCGFIIAVALVRPSKDIRDVKPKSVKKKLKDKAFARAVNRKDILDGVAALGQDMPPFIQEVIDSLSEVAAELELDGCNA
jgi:putative nucleotidyltransferase with HDIG domain